MSNISLLNQEDFKFQLELNESTLKVADAVETTEYRHGGVLESSTSDFSVSATLCFIGLDEKYGTHSVNLTGQYYSTSFDCSCSQGAMVHSLESETLNISELSEAEKLALFHKLGVYIYMS